jgi:hypothetical protein
VHEAIHGDQGATQAEKDATKLYTYRAWWRYFCNQIADQFLAPLDQMEGDTGRTYIENMITGFIATGGTIGGHSGYDSQQILIGNMGGRLRSGRYYTLFSGGDTNNVDNSYPYNGFMITLFNLMGIQPSEYAFATSNGQGFGLYTGYGANYPLRNRFYTPIQEVLTGT